MIARRLRGRPLTAAISLLAHAGALAAAYALIEWQPAPAPVVIAVELVAGASDVGEPNTPPESPPDPAPDQPSSHRHIINAPSPAPAVAPAGTPERAPEPVHEEARPLPNPEPRTQTARTENAPATPVAHPLPPLPLAKPLHIPDAAVEIGAASVDDEPSSPKTPLTASAAPETAPNGDEETSPLERAERQGSEEQVRPATTGGRIGQSTLTPMPGNPRPRYPLIARKRGYQGRVLLTVQIAGSGQVADITIAKSSGYALLDDAAMDAVRCWRFRSASGGDGPVDTIVEVPVTFKLEDTTATQP